MNHPVFRHYPRNSPQAAGRILATALLANGDMLPGYVPPAMLAKRLQSVGR